MRKERARPGEARQKSRTKAGSKMSKAELEKGPSAADPTRATAASRLNG